MQYRAEKQFLIQGIEKLGIELSSNQINQLMDFLALFCKWNETYNLSAIRNPMDMVKLHLLDSLSVAPHIRGDRILDVGTGGGLPGIPLAIAFPERQFTLLDSAGKKARFLVQVVQTLGLGNVAVENKRVEQFTPTVLFDGVVSRAFSSLLDMTRLCRHLLAENGQFWAMKGIYPKDELRALEKHYRVDDFLELNVPGVPAQRCLLCLSPLVYSSTN